MRERAQRSPRRHVLTRAPRIRGCTATTNSSSNSYHNRPTSLVPWPAPPSPPRLAAGGHPGGADGGNNGSGTAADATPLAVRVSEVPGAGDCRAPRHQTTPDHARGATAAHIAARAVSVSYPAPARGPAVAAQRHTGGTRCALHRGQRRRRLPPPR